jgi:hypothetical protein
MSKKEISIIIRAKNAVAAGLAKAGAMFKSFGESIKNIGAGLLSFGKNAAIGFGSATAAVVAFSVKALSAYAEQQKAEMALAGSLRAYGESADAVIPKLKEIAARIQDETAADDDAVIAGMAKIRMLGVQTEKLEEAAKATLALKSIGIEEAAAQRYVALAMQGNYTMLQRYIPALRTATDEADKARIVNEFFARGYQQQKDLLNTTSGAWRNLKGRIGDALESIGEAIDKSAGIKKVLNQAATAVKDFGNAVDRWIQSEKFQRLQTTLVGIVNAMKQGGSARGDALKAVADVIVEGFKLAASSAVSILMKAAPAIGKLIGAGARAAMETLKPVSLADLENAYLDTLREYLEAGAGRKIYQERDGELIAGRMFRDNKGDVRFIPEDVKKWTDDDVAVLTSIAKKRRNDETMKRMGIDGEDIPLDTSDLDSALARLMALVEKYAPEGEGDTGGEGDSPPSDSPPSNRPPPLSVSGYDPTATQRAALESVREEEAAQKEAVENAAKNEELARRRFFDKQFRKEEQDRERRKAKEEDMIKRALEDDKKGIKGAHIDRAKEIQKAREQKEKETERLEKLAEARAALEKQLADAAAETADNTLATKEAVDKLRGDLTGGG